MLLIICSINVIAEPIAEQEDQITIQIEDEVSDTINNEEITSEPEISNWFFYVLIVMFLIFLIMSIKRYVKNKKEKEEDKNDKESV